MGPAAGGRPERAQTLGVSVFLLGPEQVQGLTDQLLPLRRRRVGE